MTATCRIGSPSTLSFPLTRQCPQQLCAAHVIRSRRRQHTQLQWFTCGHSSAMNRGFSTHSPSFCSTPNTRSTAVWRLLWWQTAHTAHSLHCFWVSLQRLSVSAVAGAWLFTHGNSIPQQLLAQFSIMNTGLSTHSPIACAACQMVRQAHARTAQAEHCELRSAHSDGAEAADAQLILSASSTASPIILISLSAERITNFCELSRFWFEQQQQPLVLVHA